jgi:hypothetical protein
VTATPRMPGVCRFCGVTEDQVDGDRLSWLDGTRTCCNKFHCRKRDANEKRSKPRPPSKYPGWGYGAVAIEKRREARRRARRQRGRAA